MSKWERQDRESIKAYKAFCVYRDLGYNRSLQEAMNELRQNRGKTPVNVRQKNDPRLLERWSSKYRWVSRAEAYDEYLEGMERKERERKRKELLRKKEEGGKALQGKFIAYLKKHKDQEVTSLPLAVDCFMKGLALEEEALGENRAFEEFIEKYEDFKRKLWAAIVDIFGVDAPEKILRHSIFEKKESERG
jgi:hypothetical protein